jgi:divalent metal cation (Fe/Co/Zn/Cd) transporter
MKEQNEQSHQTGQSDQIESFFSTPTFQALTIGVPFCIFKLLFGLLALRAASEQGSATLTAFGWLIAAWAATDLSMNLARVVFHLSGRASPIEYCVIAQAGRLFGRPRLFLAIDTLISFSIICFVLWSGWIMQLSQAESYLWYAATTLNLISISVVSIWIEFRRGA